MQRTIEIAVIASSLVLAVLLRNIFIVALIVICIAGIASSSWAAWKMISIDRDMDKLRGQLGELVDWRHEVDQKLGGDATRDEEA